MDLQPDNGFVVDRVVDAKNDIERPHYEFKFHGLVYHLPFREELDSVDYRKRLVNLLNADPYLKECGMALDDYYQKHPDMKIKAAGPVGSRPYIEEAVGLDQSVHSSMRSVQERLDSFYLIKRLLMNMVFVLILWMLFLLIKIKVQFVSGLILLMVPLLCLMTGTVWVRILVGRWWIFL